MKSRLTMMVGIAMIAGPLCGLALHHWLGSGEMTTRVAADLSLVTTAFLRLIKMIIAPLVFSTLTAGVALLFTGYAHARNHHSSDKIIVVGPSDLPELARVTG